MQIFLYVLVFIVSLLLIGIILLQPSKSGGMGAAFGGIGESVFGAQAGSHLTKVTVVLTTIFFVLTLLLAALLGRGLLSKDKESKLGSIVSGQKQQQAAPAAQAAPQKAAAPAVPAAQKGAEPAKK